MEETVQNKFDLTSFAKAQERMIATNANAYGSPYGNRRYSLESTYEYTADEIKNILASGSIQAQQKLSRNFFYKDGYYRQILIYYATLLKYAGLLIPNAGSGKSLSAPHIQKKYFSALDFVESMQIPTLGVNCALRALIDGTYYGIRAESDKNVLTLIDLPAAYCCSRYKDSNGTDLIEFDLSYFNSIVDLDSRKAALAAFPKCIAKAYKEFSKNGTPKWYLIPADLGVCFPLFDGKPIFLNLIPSTIEYDKALRTSQLREAEDVKKIIIQKIPHLTDGRLLFEPDEAEEIHKGTVGMMRNNQNVSVLTTYADVDVESSSTSKEGLDSVLAQFEHNIYAQGGVSDQMFAASGTGVAYSIKKDLALMMHFATKLARYITNVVNKNHSNGNITFKYVILPVSYQNESDYINNTFKLVSSGYSFLLPAIASGLTQRDLGSVKDLENDVLKLRDKLLPLQTSYTQSGDPGDSEGGRPTLDDTQKADQTIKNEESLANT